MTSPLTASSILLNKMAPQLTKVRSLLPNVWLHFSILQQALCTLMCHCLLEKATVMSSLFQKAYSCPAAKSSKAASGWIRVLKAWADKKVSMYFIVPLCYHATSHCKERGLSELMKDRCCLLQQCKLTLCSH